MTRRTASEKRCGPVAAGAMLLALVVAGCADDDFAAGGSDWPQATYYTVIVRPGDSMSAVAGRYDVSPSVIAEMNDLDIGSRIYPGQVLRIPAATSATHAAVLAEALDDKPFGSPRLTRSVGIASRVPARSRVAVSELEPVTPVPIPVPAERTN